MTRVVTTSIFDAIAVGAADESPLWAAALLPPGERRAQPVFSPLGQARFAVGVETIYEGYLAHYGRPRLFAPADEDTALLLGDYLYAHGLVRVAESKDVAAVRDLAELISICAQSRAEAAEGEAVAWAATAALLGQDALAERRAALRDQRDPGPLEVAAREAAGDAAVNAALAVHVALVG